MARHLWNALETGRNSILTSNPTSRSIQKLLKLCTRLRLQAPTVVDVDEFELSPLIAEVFDANGGVSRYV